MSEFTEEESESLMRTLDSIESFQSMMKNGTVLNHEEIAELDDLYTFLSYFKKLTDHEEWSHKKFIVWVRQQTGTFVVTLDDLS